MVHARANISLAASADDVSGAVLIGAEGENHRGASFSILLSFRRVEGCVGASRIARHAAGRRKDGIVIRAIPIARPLPHVAGRYRTGRSRWGYCATGAMPGVTVLCPCSRPSLESVPGAYSPSASVWPELRTPRERLAAQPPRAANSHSASVGSRLPAHVRVGERVVVGDVHDRVSASRP